MILLFTPDHLNEEKKIDTIVSTISHDILMNNYDNVIINCGNFLLSESNNTAIPLIPELYEDAQGNVIDIEKHSLCFREGTLYDTRFSLKSLEMGLNVLLDAKASALANDMSILPLVSVDDKYVDKDVATKYLQQGYKAVPGIYRDMLQEALGGAKTAKGIMKIIPSIFRETGQKVSNDFILSEKELVGRFLTIRKEHLKGEKEIYKTYQESLPDKTRKCSLELFHLLKTIVNQKDVIDQGSHSKLCIVQFIPDACEGSAIASAKGIVKNREDIDIISIVPVMTGENVFVASKLTKNGEELLSQK